MRGDLNSIPHSNRSNRVVGSMGGGSSYFVSFAYGKQSIWFNSMSLFTSRITGDLALTSVGFVHTLQYCIVIWDLLGSSYAVYRIENKVLGQNCCLISRSCLFSLVEPTYLPADESSCIDIFQVYCMKRGFFRWPLFLFIAIFGSTVTSQYHGTSQQMHLIHNSI